MSVRELWATFVLLTVWVQIPPPPPAAGASADDPSRASVSLSVKWADHTCLPGALPGAQEVLRECQLLPPCPSHG